MKKLLGIIVLGLSISSMSVKYSFAETYSDIIKRWEGVSKLNSENRKYRSLKKEIQELKSLLNAQQNSSFKDHTYSNGDHYIGQSLNSKRHGQGTYTWKSGKQYKGEFAFHHPDGTGMMKYVSGATYLGEWKKGKRHGYGQWKSSSGNTYIGDWIRGKFEGQGTYYNKSGEYTYSGEWKNGKANGKGTSIDKDGVKNTGIWKDNNLITLTE
jgi:hypothetical protein